MVGPAHAAGDAGSTMQPLGGVRAPRAPALVPGQARAVRLLGGFEVSIAGRPARIPAALERAVAHLALRGRCSRSRMAGTLWPETTELRARANLRTGIWRINQVAPGIVVSRHDDLALAEDVDVDVNRLVDVARSVLEGTPGAPHEPTLQYVDGDLLPDWTDEWLTVDRERLRQLQLHVLETLAGRLAAEGLFGMAMEAALAALRAEPLRESAHRAVIRIHLAEGNLAEAVTAYRQCRARLARDIGVAPAPETTGLLSDLPRLGTATV
jgi:DNA-binding SARP family transcriptional activator